MKTLIKTNAFLFISLIVLISCNNTINGPKKTVGDWHHEISKNMGGFQISQSTTLTIIRNGPGDYEYLLSSTVLDQMYGGQPKTEHSRGKLEGTTYEHKWRFIDGAYGKRGAYIVLPPGEWESDNPIELNVEFDHGRGSLMTFIR